MIQRGFWLAVLALTAFLNHPQKAFSKPNEEVDSPELKILGDAVLKLLSSGKTNDFVTIIAPHAEDWTSLLPISPPPEETKNDLDRMVTFSRNKVAESAQTFLQKAGELGLQLSKLDWQVTQVSAENVGSFSYPGLMREGEEAPWASEIVVSLEATTKSENEADRKFAGKYKAALEQNRKLDGKWRSHDGIRWAALPEGVGGVNAKFEMEILEIAKRRKPLTSEMDPALKKLGEDLTQFFQKKDPEIFATAAFADIEAIWAKIPASQQANRTDFEEAFSRYRKKLKDSAAETLKLLEEQGIDLGQGKMEFKNATLKTIYHRGKTGALDELQGSEMTFVYNVTAPETKSKTGQPVSGEYVLRCNRGKRQDDKWTLEESIGWLKLPKGLVSKESLEKMELENHIAANGVFPRGYTVPDIEMIQLDADKLIKLSDLRGNIVVIDFWATWCGPCQEPMAKLQTLVTDHPEWNDKVKILSLSIDTDVKKLRSHLESKGWTNSINTWAGKGGWDAPPAKAFRVRGVPTSYVIDRDGKVIWSGHPFGNAMTHAITAAVGKQ